MTQSVMGSGADLVGNTQILLSNGVHFLQNFFREFSEIWEMRRHYQAMREQLVSYRQFEMDAQRLLHENERLRRLWSIEPDASYHWLVGRVIARDPTNLMHGFTINRGASSGIEERMIVIAYNETEQIFGLVGRVHEVFSHTALVRPLTNPELFIAGRIIPSGFEGLVDGGSWNGEQLYFSYLSRNALNHIGVGDRVVSSGLGIGGDSDDFIPRDIYIGTIGEVIDDRISTSITAILRSVVDLSRLDFIYILTPEENSHAFSSERMPVWPLADTNDEQDQEIGDLELNA